MRKDISNNQILSYRNVVWEDIMSDHRWNAWFFAELVFQEDFLEFFLFISKLSQSFLL